MKYGQTWWGGEWLNALAHIDYSNRLPRGRNYANKGAVKDIHIAGKTISARVQGTRIAPYKVTVEIPAFSDSEKKTLTNVIMENPLMLSRLLNRELPAALNSISHDHGIRIFPQRWDDLKMHCSCPDWAVPCKHLAAVINMIANEIDRNPFVIFKLHGYDIIEELKKGGMEAVEEAVVIPDHHMLVAAEPGQTYVTGELSESELLDGIDFSVIEDLRENMLSLVSGKPVFYSRDFKSILDKIYKRTAKHYTREYRQTNAAVENSTVNYEKYSDVEFSLNRICFFSSCTLKTDSESVVLTDPEELISFLSGIPPRFISKLSPGLLSLYFTWHFACRLVEKSAYMPQIVKLSDRGFTIRWIPAVINEQTRKVFDCLADTIPGRFVIMEDETTQPQPAEQLKRIVSVFIQELICKAGFDRSLSAEPVPRIFLDHASNRFDKLGEGEIPASIQRWTDKFFLSHQKYIPVLKISEDEAGGDFKLSVLVENSQESLKEPVPLKEIMASPVYDNIKYEILRNLELLTPSFPALESTIATSGKQSPSFNADEFAEVMFRILPVIRMFGIKVILPVALRHLVRPKVSISLSAKGAGSLKSFINLTKILAFQWKIALGDELMEKEEFLKLVQNLSGIVKIRQQYVYLNPSDIKSLMEQISKEEQISRNQLLQAAITGEYEGTRISIDKETQEMIDALLRADNIELPAGLNAQLRPYQQRGYNWLYKNAQVGFGSIIADDMGLGKTLQVIVILLKLKHEGELDSRQTLIVVPTTLITNWQKEFDKFAPDLTCSVYHGPNRILNTGTDVVLTSYGITRSDNETLSKPKWKAVIIDEAQNIKNPGAGQTRAVKSLKSDIRIAMSGTPVENRLSEYWSIFDFTNKGYLGSLKSFTEKFAVPIEVERNKNKLSRFLKITGPFILRRLKSDKSVISDLPDKIENNYYASLVKEQAAIYQNVLDTIMNTIEDVDLKEKEGNIQRRGLVLKLIMALKQVCNHPSQYLKKEDYSPELSGKASLFLSFLENILENDEKVLVFTQFREMGKILEQLIMNRFDRKCLFLHGGCSRKQRDEMVEQFQTNPHRKILILTIKAGGTGLNLTAASHVIHYDLWWNPAVEAQATDRAYRIGQDKKVMVYRLITKGTFEEKIDQMLTRKKELASLTVSSGEKWISDLSNRELKSLFSMSAH